MIDYKNYPKSTSQYYTPIKNELKVFSNISCIIEKVEHDGNLLLIENTLKNVIENELIFTICGFFKKN